MSEWRTKTVKISFQMTILRIFSVRRPRVTALRTYAVTAEKRTASRMYSADARRKNPRRRPTTRMQAFLQTFPRTYSRERTCRAQGSIPRPKRSRTAIITMTAKHRARVRATVTKFIRGQTRTAQAPAERRKRKNISGLEFSPCFWFCFCCLSAVRDCMAMQASKKLSARWTMHRLRQTLILQTANYCTQTI